MNALPPTEQPPTTPISIDAFILFNEQEKGIEQVVKELEAQGVRTFFWRRDIPYGQSWEIVEAQQLRDAQVVLVFLGAAGWGPTHLNLALKAQYLKKWIIPVLLAEPPQGAKMEAGNLFTQLRYFDLRDSSPDAIHRLAHVIQGNESEASAASYASVDAMEIPQPPTRIEAAPSSNPSRLSSAFNDESDGQFDAIIDVFIKGDQPAQLRELEFIRTSPSLNRPALAARLREEIQGRYGVWQNGKEDFGSSIRSTDENALVRSWLLGALVWSDAEGNESREVLLAYLDAKVEPFPNARFWTLGGLYRRKASYVAAAAARCAQDPEMQVATLAQIINLPSDPEGTDSFARRRSIKE